MRISDWSSDVCSSDLHKRALAPARSWSATGSRHRRRSGGGNWGNSWHYSFTAGGWPVGRGENGGAQHVGGPVEPAMAQPVRSEEHTSELQSLLRISYAGFRLKTKKRHMDCRYSCTHSIEGRSRG